MNTRSNTSKKPLPQTRHNNIGLFIDELFGAVDDVQKGLVKSLPKAKENYRHARS